MYTHTTCVFAVDSDAFTETVHVWRRVQTRRTPVVAQAGLDGACYAALTVATSNGDRIERRLRVPEFVEETPRTTEAFLDAETAQVVEVLDRLAWFHRLS
jgi:hypothetical protein